MEKQNRIPLLLVGVQWRRIERLARWFAGAAIFGAGALMAAIPSVGMAPGIFVVFLGGHLVCWVDCVRHRHLPVAVMNVGLCLLDVYAIFARY